MKQTVTVVYEKYPGAGMNIIRLEGTPLPDGVKETLTKDSKEEFVARFKDWKQIYDDGHVMVFEKDS